MSRTTHILIQLALVGAQGLNALLPLLTGDKKLIAMTVIAMIQGGVGVVAHAYNTDGTPQAAAFQKAPN